MTGPARRVCLVPALLSLLGVGAGAAGPADKVISSIDLSKAFHTRSPWRFLATQGARVPDENGYGEEPGSINVCLKGAVSRNCDPSLRSQFTSETDFFRFPHYLNRAEIVRPRIAGSRAMLLVQFATRHGTNGGQGVMTQALAYDESRDGFRSLYQYAVGTNNNDEVRYIATGPLQDAIISAEPTDNAPYGYWVTVNRPGKDLSYRPVLRYRSATHYNDGNPLAVIDSEMPNIQRRLGLWRPGQKLPLPQAGCPRPRLVRTELWCN